MLNAVGGSEQRRGEGEDEDKQVGVTDRTKEKVMRRVRGRM